MAEHQNFTLKEQVRILHQSKYQSTYHRLDRDFGLASFPEVCEQKDIGNHVFPGRSTASLPLRPCLPGTIKG